MFYSSRTQPPDTQTGLSSQESYKTLQTSNTEVTLWSHDLISWKQNTTLCDHPKVDRSSVLNTPSGAVGISVYDPKKDIWVSKRIVETGDFDGRKRQLVFELINNDEKDVNFIDIGCNVGVYSLTMAKMGRKVLCIDALYLNVKHVCASIIQNNFQKSITIVMNALSNNRKYVELGIDSRNYGGTFVDEDADFVKRKKGGTATGEHYTSISSIVMDDLLLLPSINMFRKSFIKMDIEGFEWKALERASAFFKAIDVRGVFIEWIFHRGKESGEKITEFLIQHNLYPHAQVSPTTYRPLDITKKGNWNFMDILWLKR
ncbi:uncharacterized protein LOC133196762 [Saccostrea echinata]|uniref:uncharacterized protein LOC133196762 n=1 Tax=Saccostrea echinata TaxID=191078 RepID=UPI002A804490|nr:uncharacterized protein LOC133196762 [Saccostrea echinata]